MEYVKKEVKKISSMILLLIGFYMAPYNLFVLLGTFLCIEHIYTYSRTNFWDFLGHEWIGLILFIIGAILSFSWIPIIPFILGWCIICDYEYFSPIKYIKLKIKSLK
jgi:hypothetical protein